jgi:hypothetical protein
MSPDDPGGALRDIADQLPGLHGEVTALRGEVRGDRRKIRWLTAASVVLALATLGAVSWTAYQQTVINSKSAAIARLAGQNRDIAAAQARRDRDLCVRLVRSRAELFPVWKHLLSERPGDAAWLPRVAAAEPLVACPKAPPGS